MNKQLKLRIEQGVPIPPIATRQGQNIQLLMSMQPGDSVFFDAPIADKAVRFYRVAKKLGIQIVIRKEKGGSRMWRVTGDQPVVSMATRPAATRSHKAKDTRKSAVQHTAPTSRGRSLHSRGAHA